MRILIKIYPSGADASSEGQSAASQVEEVQVQRRDRGGGVARCSAGLSQKQDNSNGSVGPLAARVTELKSVEAFNRLIRSKVARRHRTAVAFFSHPAGLGSIPSVPEIFQRQN